MLVFYIDLYGDIFFLPTGRQNKNVAIQVYVKKQNFRDIYKIGGLKLGLHILDIRLPLLHRKNLGWLI